MSHEIFLDGRVQLCCGSSLHFLRDQPDARYDSIVTDPPYALAFMGKTWDTGETAMAAEFWAECLRVLKPGGHVVAFGGTRTYHRLACAIEDGGFEVRDQIGWCFGQGFPKSHDAGNGWGTALKPAWEPICLARKPLSEDTVAGNVLQYGTGATNVDGCRIGGSDDYGRSAARADGIRSGYDNGIFGGEGAKPKDYASASGRWPANIIHDGSDEVIAAFPETTSGANGIEIRGDQNRTTYGEFNGGERSRAYDANSGSAARFFYTAKADADDRLGSKHPTVKPVDLMQWLVRLVTPKGGLVLDPFAGTGTTAEACFREGMRCMLVERETEYQQDIRRRIALVMAGPDERARESIKARTADQPIDHGPLFAWNG